MEAHTSKRIVSKREYVRQVMTLLSLGAAGTAVWLLSGLCAFGGLSLVILIVGSSMYAIRGEMGVQWPFCFGLLALLLAVAARVLWLRGLPMMDRALSTKLDVPVTRANTSDISASDSLVRASAEPVMMQATVLLRAITETQGQEVSDEQLLRAAIE